jgi:hypothetical protein
VRTALLIIGVLAALLGLIWIGQGTGYFPYPAESFMVRQTSWAYYGAGLVVFGLVLIGASRKIGG